MRVNMTCGICGGTNVSKDGNAVWSVDKQEWVLSDVFDKPNWCEDCGETVLKEVEVTEKEE